MKVIRLGLTLSLLAAVAAPGHLLAFPAQPQETASLAGTSTNDRQSKIALIERLYAAVAKGDKAGIAEVLDPSVVFQEAASLPYGGTYEGHAGFNRLIEALGKSYSRFESSNLYYMVDGDRIVVRFHISATVAKTGKSFDQDVSEEWQLRGGRLASAQAFYFDTQAIAKAFEPDP